MGDNFFKAKLCDFRYITCIILGPNFPQVKFCDTWHIFKFITRLSSIESQPKKVVGVVVVVIVVVFVSIGLVFGGGVVEVIIGGHTPWHIGTIKYLEIKI